MDATRYRESLLYLVKYLCEEEGVRRPPRLGDTGTDELFTLFRSLVNVRVPRRATDEFYRVQDEMLRATLEGKGIAHVRDLRHVRGNERIAFYSGDICTIDADAIVNAANSQMLGCWVPGHNCIDNAIHTFAGVQLREECQRIMQAQGHEEPTGQAKVTGAYNLPSGCIIHTVGPISQGRADEPMCNALASCYRACLDAAESRACTSIVFCCISTGVFGFPNDVAAEVAVKTVLTWLDEHPESQMLVVFDLFAKRDRQIYHDLLESR